MVRNGLFMFGLCVLFVCSGVSPVMARGVSDLVRQAYRLIDGGELDQAKRLFIDAVQSQGGDTLALEGLATSLYLSNDLERAKRTLNILVRRDEGSAYARALLGTLLYGENNFAEAIVHLRRAADMDPRRPSFFNNLGVALMDSGNDEAAEDAFRSALNANSRHAEANYNLAVLLATGRNQNLRAARRHYNDALRAGFPRDPRLDHLLGSR